MASNAAKEKDFFHSMVTWGFLMYISTSILKGVGVDVLPFKEVLENVTEFAGMSMFMLGQFRRNSKITSIAGMKLN